MDIGRYIAQDRRRALALGRDLPDRSVGSVLLASIVGFAALGERLTAQLGEPRGIEALVRRIDQVYEALIVEIERRGGAVVGFAGDALTCWFDIRDGRPPPAHRAVACAQALQSAMSALLPAGDILDMKVAVASGSVRRFAPGDPRVQRLDILAGATLSRAARAEQLAHAGGIVVDRPTADALDAAAARVSWRAAAGDPSFAVLEHGALADDVGAAADSAAPAVPFERLQPWLLRAVSKREHDLHGVLLPELRPTVSLFIRFDGIDYDDEDAAGRLDHVVLCIQAQVEAQGGVVLQLAIDDKGSHAYACFGAPVAHEDDALRAVRAAHELMRALGELKFLAPVRMGLSAGTARAGAYGGRTRATYGVLGDDVGLAAQLMALAGPGETLLSEALRRPAATQFLLRALQPLHVEGHAEPVSVHTLVGPRSLGTTRRAQARRHGLAMVGRQRELALIERKLVLAAQGQSQVIGIAGDAGIGKSRLVVEVVPFAQRHEFTACLGQCEAAGQGTPYLAWRSIWRALLGVPTDVGHSDNDDAGNVASLRERLRILAPQHSESLPTLAPLLGIAIEDNEFTRSLAPQDRANALSGLLEECLTSAAAARPLLLVLEDVHWMDPVSLRLLEDLARVGANLPLAFVITYRPPLDSGHTQARVEKLPGFTRIAMEMLKPDEVVQMVENKLAQWEPGRSQELAGALAAKLNARAEGNPFYIEELLNYLQQRHVELNLALVASDEPVALPASLHALILSRIDLLTESQRITLMAASVIGRHFRVDWLHGCYPRLGEMHRVSADLVELQRLDLTMPDQPEPELSYLFKHVLAREVAYESLPIATRQQMHGQLAAYLESIDAQRHVDLLAHHYSLSGNVGKQREYLERAAVAAQRAYANEAAIGYYSRLILLVDEPRALTALLRERAQLLVHVGRWVDAQADCARALELAERAGDADAVAAAVVEELGKLARLRGDGEAALRFWQRSLAMNETAGTRRDCGRIHAEIAELHAVTGRPTQALAHMHEALGIAGQSDDPSVECRMLMLGSWLDPELGEYDDVRRRVLEATQVLRDRNDKSHLLAALNAVAVVECEYGRYARARDVHEQAIELARSLGAMPMFVRHLANFARACCCGGDLPAARAAIEQTIAPMRELRWSLGLPVVLTRQAEYALLQGELQVARESLHEALALMREHSVRSALPLGLHLLGHLMLAEGDLPQAHRTFHEAMQAAAGAGVQRTFSSSTLVGFARLAVMTGALPEAARIAAAVRPLDATYRRPLDWYVGQWLADVQARCREGLSAAAWAEAESEGAHLTLDAALAIASGLGERIGERAIDP